MNPKQRQSAQWQALPGCGHAERALQASWWQEHGAAHAGGPRAQQASKLETRALFAGSQGGTVARAGGNTCGPLSARLDLRPPRSRGRIRTTPDKGAWPAASMQRPAATEIVPPRAAIGNMHHLTPVIICLVKVVRTADSLLGIFW